MTGLAGREKVEFLIGPKYQYMAEASENLRLTETAISVLQ